MDPSYPEAERYLIVRDLSDNRTQWLIVDFHETLNWAEGSILRDTSDGRCIVDLQAPLTHSTWPVIYDPNRCISVDRDHVTNFRWMSFLDSDLPGRAAASKARPKRLLRSKAVRWFGRSPAVA